LWLVGGVLLLLLGVLSGSPEPLDEPLNNIGLIEQGASTPSLGHCGRSVGRAVG
jgi:hypothetical protein